MTRKAKDPKSFETLPVWKQTKEAILALKADVSESSEYPATVSPLLEKCILAYREKHGLAIPEPAEAQHA